MNVTYNSVGYPYIFKLLFATPLVDVFGWLLHKYLNLLLQFKYKS